MKETSKDQELWGWWRRSPDEDWRGPDKIREPITKAVLRRSFLSHYELKVN